MTLGEVAPLLARRLRSAMFVDFDNVYLGLQRLDPDAAKSFAEDPARWVGALTDGAGEDGPFARRFLIRKCYLNPASFSRYRPNFTRAGFQVVDCPSLTQQGKSSADISLVLDAVDALSAATHFDEFVFLSADADFTPLLTRCRAADRQVTIITPGPAAAAYRAVADTVVAVDLFIGMLTPQAPGEVLDVSAPVPPGTTDVVTQAASAPSPDAAAAAVRQLVATSDRPVVLAAAAAAASRAEPSLRQTEWAGTRSFSGWLHRVLPDLPLHTRAPGYVWDPSRFSEADLPESSTSAQDTSALTELQRQVVGITEVPPLSQDDYRLLLDQLTFDLALFPFSRTDTSKRVRDECAKRERPVGRAAINSVITGLLLAGADLTAEPEAAELAAVWAENVLALCRGARIELSESEAADIADWVGGGYLERRSV